jgi:hypothetical protein
MDGSVIAWDTKIRGYGYTDCYVAAHAIAGEPRYRSLLKYWTGGKGPGGGFMRGASSYLPALELLDYAKWKTALVDWAEKADLSHPGHDGMGRAARERYMKFEAAGDEKAALEALEACVRKMRLTFEAHTWGEPINDRIWLPDHPLIMMAQGEISHERNQLWPRHYVSYEGFADFAAWVREKSDTSLRLWLYNFAEETDAGRLRVWRTPLGEYEAVLGPDANADGKPDRGAVQRFVLHRSAAIPLRLPPRQLYVLALRLRSRSREDFWSRPDLAVSADDTVLDARGRVKVVVHNVGGGPARDVSVGLFDGQGRELAKGSIAGIEAPLDLKPRTASLNLSAGKARTVEVRVDAGHAIPELNEENNTVRLDR